MDHRTAQTFAPRRALLVFAAAGALLLAACAPVVTTTTTSTIPTTRTNSNTVRATSATTAQVVDIPSDTRGALEVVLADGRTFKVPPGHFPPPGACRIWHPNRPPGQQPPPGDCSELLATVSADSVVLRR